MQKEINSFSGKYSVFENSSLSIFYFRLSLLNCCPMTENRRKPFKLFLKETGNASVKKMFLLLLKCRAV